MQTPLLSRNEGYSINGVPMYESSQGEDDAVLTYCFENLSCVVPLQTKKRSLKVLDGICGALSSGQVLAILGPSGAGKTSLLDILAGRKTVGAITGSITLNGHPHTAQDSRYWVHAMFRWGSPWL